MTISGARMDEIRRPHYHANIHLARPQSHVLELLIFCKTFLPVAMVSASPDDVEAHLSHFRINEFFDHIRLKARPKDQALMETIVKLKFTPTSSVYVDDT